MILVGFRNDYFLKNKVSYCKPDKTEKIKTFKEALKNIPKWSKHQELTKHDERVVRRLKKTKEGQNVWDLGDDEDGLPDVKKARMSQIYKRLDSTKPATSGANVPQNHKSCRTPIPTIANIGTRSTFTNCVQT